MNDADGSSERWTTGGRISERPFAGAVHVLGPGWAVVVDLLGPDIREAINCSAREARRAVQLVATHRDVLMEAWRQIHG